jgi:hypothetical protein
MTTERLQKYSPFLLEAAAAVWVMDIFNKYLRGTQFILCTDYKPLENWAIYPTRL